MCDAFPLCEIDSQFFSSTFSAIIKLTMSSMCETSLSSTNHPMVHRCSSITLFSMHRSYGLIASPKYDSVVDTKSYHSRALYIMPYIAFKICTHSTFFPFSYVTNFLCSVFTLHIMSTNYPSYFMCATLSSGSDTWIYAPKMSKVCAALPSWESINNDTNSAYSLMVGGVNYSHGI